MLHPYVHYLLRAARRWPDLEAVLDIDRDRSFSWAELAARVSRLASELAAQGVLPGTRVGVRQANTHTYLEAVCAVAWCGAAFVPTLDSLPDSERRDIYGDVEPVAILDARESLDGVIRAHEPILPVQGSPGSLSQVLYTSGSAGRPKGVMHTYWSTEAAMAAWAGLTRSEARATVLVTTPISHAAGRLVESSLVNGDRVVIASSGRASTVVPVLEQHRVTHMLLVPTVLQQLVDSPEIREHDTSSLRFVLYSSAPASPSLVSRAHNRLGPVLHSVYGSTEAPAPNTHLNAREHAYAVAEQPDLLLSCGREYWSGVQLRLVDDDMQDVAEGDLGQLAVASTWNACGYWRQPDTWAARFRDGWLLTGDIGRREGDYIYLADRRDDMIITGGYNVFPTEVENAISEDPRVREVAVISEPDARWGEAVIAVVAADDGVAEQDIIEHCRRTLSRHKVPKRVVFLPELPKSGHGKLSRRLVRDVVVGASSRIHGAE